MKFKLVLCLFLISVGSLSAQVKRPPLKIQEIVLKDSVLIQQIERLIQDEINNEEDEYEFFKSGLGYINLHVLNYSDRDVIRKYVIYPGMTAYRKSSSDELYPLFYSFVANRMVLIYIDPLYRFANFRFTQSSKRQFRKKLEPYLEKPQNITARDSDGNIVIRDKHFRIDWFRLHSGRYIYIFHDMPPLVLNESEEQLRQHNLK